ncbi:MAG TPA: tryptophan synthase subunit alpha [Nitrososphaeraceae archaeon]|jgi:tryptophan synthase alpha chain|nr:tryptophan synthase subunit alpha [Nitrososphaeraceae archaeon]HSL13217.1 tryptophan synthase subunit alpha [Nitrososphaeraceae archaeon]
MYKSKSISKENRIASKFNELKSKNQKALICYVVAGYPDIITSERIITSLINGGADIIEIGIPFSDPIADGSTIQDAIQNSLIAGTTPDMCLELASRIRKTFPNIPLIIMTYSNILYRKGYIQFAKKAKESGIDGFIIPDIPIEESKEYLNTMQNIGMSTIFLVSPNTSEKRLKMISRICTGFLYAISVYGTTGERQSFDEYTIESIKRIKKMTADDELPLAVGFGISNPQHVKDMINAGADGVIIGSAIIKKIKELENKESLFTTLNRFISELKNSCS